MNHPECLKAIEERKQQLAGMGGGSGVRLQEPWLSAEQLLKEPRLYYECHITFFDRNFTSDPDDSSSWRNRQPSVDDWKFSQIDGDPVLGLGVKSYLTKHMPQSRPLADVIDELDRTVVKLNEHGFNVVRRKVELVVFDKIEL